MSGRLIRGALLGVVLGLPLAVVTVAFVVVVGLGREGVLSVPGLVQVVSGPEGFTVETGAGLLAVPLTGAGVGALFAARRGGAPEAPGGPGRSTSRADRA